MDDPDALDQRALFHAERRSAITSTDVPGILGLSRYSTALSCYRDKRGESPERPTTLPMWLGNSLEGIVSQLYTAATGLRVRADNRFLRHHEYQWFGCHLDRRVVGDPDLIVELKTRDRMTGWGEDGSDKVPVDVWAQCQSQLIITRARECHVAALFSNREFRVYRLLPDPEFEANLIPTLSDFWFNYALAGVPPAPSGSDVDTFIVNGTPGGASGHLLPATPEQEQVVEKLRVARLNAAAADLRKTEAENVVKKLIGEDYDGITGGFGAVNWKRTADINKTDWKLLAGTYEKAARELLGLIDASEAYVYLDKVRLIDATLDAAPGLYTAVTPGGRRMDCRFKEQESDNDE